jgi:hypothetical protein
VPSRRARAPTPSSRTSTLSPLHVQRRRGQTPNRLSQPPKSEPHRSLKAAPARLPPCRLGGCVDVAAALGASRLGAEVANHAGYVFEASGASWRERCSGADPSHMRLRCLRFCLCVGVQCGMIERCPSRRCRVLVKRRAAASAPARSARSGKHSRARLDRLAATRGPFAPRDPRPRRPDARGARCCHRSHAGAGASVVGLSGWRRPFPVVSGWRRTGSLAPCRGPSSMCWPMWGSCRSCLQGDCPATADCRSFSWRTRYRLPAPWRGHLAMAAVSGGSRRSWRLARYSPRALHWAPAAHSARAVRTRADRIEPSAPGRRTLATSSVIARQRDRAT